MKKWLVLISYIVCLTACSRYQQPVHPSEEPLAEIAAESAVQVPRNELPAAVVKPAGESEPPYENGNRLQPKKTAQQVKGVYISAFVAGTESMMDEILEKITSSQINAVVIDVKDDNGNITFAMNSPLATEIGSCKAYISDIENLIENLKAQDLYVIARVVAFRDPFLAEKKPEWSLVKADGSVYRDRKGMAWINPYKKGVWEYLAEIGQQAAEIGFDEVQFDYIRFSTEKGMDQVVFDPADTGSLSKTEIITSFTEYMYQQLGGQIFVSADVFGTIIGSERDAQIVGQVYAEMAERLDYLSPMIYPSHYAEGNFGLAYPDLQPYETVRAALEASKADLALLTERTAVVRPWLQDFTASYLEHYQPYGAKQVREQIQAVYDSGHEEWILWNASCKYSWEALREEENIDSMPQ